MLSKMVIFSNGLQVTEAEKSPRHYTNLQLVFNLIIVYHEL